MKLNKSREIRRVAKDLKAKGLPARPRDIVAILQAEGINVARSQVSIALIRTPWEPRSEEFFREIAALVTLQKLGQSREKTRPAPDKTQQ